MIPRRYRKGAKAENIFFKACSQLKKEGKIEGFKQIDLPGKDFVIYFPDTEIAVDVKSSFAAEFYHRYLKKYETPVIVVPLNGDRISAKREKRLIGRAKREILEVENKKRL